MIEAKRTTGIAVVCVAVALAAAIDLSYLVQGVNYITGLTWLIHLIFLGLCVTVIVGLWNMKKWGAQAYALVFILTTAFHTINNLGLPNFISNLTLYLATNPFIYLGFIVLAKYRVMA